MLQGAGEEGEDVYRTALEVVEEGKTGGFLRLEGYEKKVNGGGGQRPRGEVIGRGAEFDVGRNGKNLQRIRITAEIDGVRCGYTITFGWRGARNEAVGRAYVSVDAPRRQSGGRREVLGFGGGLEEPWVHCMRGGKIRIVCYKECLDGFAGCA